VNVTATSTAISTHTAATVPIRPRKPIPETLRASSATSTVAPANTTALPAVPLARPIDSRTSMPARTWVRCRLRMNSE
jgi:hypothetical protein